MSDRWRFYVIAIGLLVVAIGGTLKWLRFNSTASIPIGIYVTSSKEVRLDDYVIFCPPDSAFIAEARARDYIPSGICPGGYLNLMKRVAAVGGDRVSFRPDGVYVNGTPWPKSERRSHDNEGRELPALDDDRELNSDELLLMSDASSAGFDSRYFGLIQRRQIKSVIQPLLTW